MALFNYVMRILSFVAPILTIVKVVRAGENVGEDPRTHTLTLIRCILGSWYQTEYIRGGEVDTVVVAINLLGICFECICLLVLYIYSTERGRDKLHGCLLITIGSTLGTMLASVVFKHWGYSARFISASAVTVASILSVLISFYKLRDLILIKLTQFFPQYIMIDFSFFELRCGTIALIAWKFYGELLHPDRFILIGDVFSALLIVAKMIYYLTYWAMVEEDREVWSYLL